MKNIACRIIDPLKHKEDVVRLINQLNPKLGAATIETLLKEMTKIPTYTCFALFEKEQLIGVSSGWTTVRIYCGKQLELDNVIIDSNIQSKGFGKYFIDRIKQWSVENDYESMSLNTYVENHRSHKFYFNQGFKVIGFHFENRLNA